MLNCIRNDDLKKIMMSQYCEFLGSSLPFFKKRAKSFYLN